MRRREDVDFSAPSGFGEPSTFAGPQGSSFESLAETPPNLDEGGWTKPKKKVSEGLTSAQNNASIDQRNALIAAYGTANKDKVAELMSLGVFEKDAGTRYKLDPEGFKENVGAALKILGRDGINETPDGEEARIYRKGTGQAGEAYYTNLTNKELGDEQRARRGTDAHADESRHPAYGLVNMNMQDLAPGSSGALDEKRAGMSDAEQMFEGKLDRATDRALKDERDMQHTSDLATYSDELLQYGREQGGNKAKERIQQELMDGTFLKKKFTGKEAILLNRALDKHIRTQKQIYHGKLDPNFFITDVHRNPVASDPSQPSSFANPEGGPNPQAITTYDHMQADNNHQQVVSGSVDKDGGELPRTAQYATGKKPPKLPPRSVIAEGGTGGEGYGADIEKFLSGEGRHGTGDDSWKGRAEDAAAFYGPRLPGMIAEAAGGVGVKRAAGTVGKKLLGLRAIENMLGKF